VTNREPLPIDDKTAALIRSLGADGGRYVEALVLVQQQGTSVMKAAREAGVDASRLRKIVNSAAAKGQGDDALAIEADRQIEEMSQTVALLAAEQLIDRLENEGDTMKNQELIKSYRAGVETVAAKRRWNQGGHHPSEQSGASVLASLLEEGDLTITKRDPSREAIDVSAPDMTGRAISGIEGAVED